MYWSKEPLSSLEYSFLPLMYLVWNVLNVIYAMKLLAVKGAEGTGFLMSESFARKYGLSEREREVGEFFINGLNHKKIAEKLYITPGNVRNHLHKVYEKTGVNSLIDMLLLVKKEG